MHNIISIRNGYFREPEIIREISGRRQLAVLLQLFKNVGLFLSCARVDLIVKSVS